VPENDLVAVFIASAKKAMEYNSHKDTYSGTLFPVLGESPHRKFCSLA
jgi:hypothetical protein